MGGNGKNENRLSEELRLIPRWSVAAAAAAFALVEYYFWIALPALSHHPSRLPFALHCYLLISWGALAALSMLIVGYISRDAPRRGMSARLWVTCVVVPGGVGAALYFLLRQPVLASCPACGAHIEGGYHFCPQCAYRVAACCGNCYRGVRVTDLYCPHCGHDLAADHLPERLHAFSIQGRG